MTPTYVPPRTHKTSLTVQRERIIKALPFPLFFYALRQILPEKKCLVLRFLLKEPTLFEEIKNKDAVMLRLPRLLSAALTFGNAEGVTENFGTQVLGWSLCLHSVTAT